MNKDELTGFMLIMTADENGRWSPTHYTGEDGNQRAFVWALTKDTEAKWFEAAKELLPKVSSGLKGKSQLLKISNIEVLMESDFPEKDLQ